MKILYDFILFLENTVKASQTPAQKAKEARKNLIKAIEKCNKSHGKGKSTFKSDLVKKYGR